jgi:hypothetical protein
MTVYKLVIKKSVAKDLRPIPEHDIGRILKCIEFRLSRTSPNN